jgi:hypothetical protein
LSRRTPIADIQFSKSEPREASPLLESSEPPNLTRGGRATPEGGDFL